MAAACLFDGFGGINLGNIKLTVENLGYTWDLEMQQKLTAIAAKVRENK